MLALLKLEQPQQVYCWLNNVTRVYNKWILTYPKLLIKVWYEMKYY